MVERCKRSWDESYSQYYFASLPRSSQYRVRKWAQVLYKWMAFILLLACLFATLLWDMSNLNTLSRNIHDDHSSFWIDIRKKQVKRWISPLDMCTLQNKDADVLPAVYASSNCSKHLPKSKKREFLSKQFCSVVFGLGSSCEAPHIDRPYFTKMIRGSVIGNVTTYNLKATMRSLARARKSLVFIGDSSSKQNAQALFCELMKVDSVTIKGDLWNPINVTVEWPLRDVRQKLTMSVHYIAFNGIRPRPGVEINGTYPAHVHNPHHHRTDLTDLKSTVSSLGEQHPGGLVVVINVGSAYLSRMKFRDDIGYILDWLEEVGVNERNLVLFRESAAQHWNHTTYGYKGPETQLGEPSQCVPLEDASPQLDWRNHEVQSYIRLQEISNVHIVPFRDVTTPLFNMHHSPPHVTGDVDCAAYCYFPQLWQGIWTGLSFSVYVFSTGRNSAAMPGATKIEILGTNNSVAS
mmetsp:Transcript_12998/g.19598  ORF Transcript_12998/g.19598 Transcript_12998/m.19598 type:complete len:463 (-) Transcript_12998:13-1401(-)